MRLSDNANLRKFNQQKDTKLVVSGLLPYLTLSNEVRDRRCNTKCTTNILFSSLLNTSIHPFLKQIYNMADLEDLNKPFGMIYSASHTHPTHR